MIEDKKLVKKDNFGVYLGSASEYYGMREIFYGVLLCSETGDEIKILAVRLKKAKTN
jgi:hypothetical protein